MTMLIHEGVKAEAAYAKDKTLPGAWAAAAPRSTAAAAALR